MSVISIPVIENPDGGSSLFSEDEYSLDDFNGMWISDRQTALNFRYRTSEPGYSSTWHVAGDPTLIIICQGILRLRLRDGSFRDFSKGQQFIARDRLLFDQEFDPAVHGHAAEVFGEEQLQAVHIKLAQL